MNEQIELAELIQESLLKQTGSAGTMACFIVAGDLLAAGYKREGGAA